MHITDKVAIVTGGSKGIGYAIAVSLMKKGAKVLITGRDKAALRDAVSTLSKFGHVEAESCDVRSEDQVRMLFEQCDRLFGGVDILVNNAGIGIMGKTVEEFSGDDWRRLIETNLNGVFYGSHYAVPRMRERGGGYIINISSLAGQNAHPKMAAYNASKFGLNGFSDALMQEVRADNIKVSHICPGSVNTDFGDRTADPEATWQLQPTDVAEVVIDLLNADSRALISKVELRPSRPPSK